MQTPCEIPSSYDRSDGRNPSPLTDFVTPLLAIDIAIRIAIDIIMRTVQMTLDKKLVAAVDKAAKKLGMTRSSFTRKVLREALARLRTEDLERQHREGYERLPVQPGEFDVFESIQAWGDDDDSW